MNNHWLILVDRVVSLTKKAFVKVRFTTLAIPQPLAMLMMSIMYGPQSWLVDRMASENLGLSHLRSVVVGLGMSLCIACFQKFEQVPDVRAKATFVASNIQY